MIDNKLFVVFDLSSDIEVYDAQTLSHLSNIEVKGLTEPQDIVACHEEHQLYVADKDGIWRVSTTDGYINRCEKWLTTESSTSGFYAMTLSLTSCRLLATLPSGLRQYSTTDKELLRVIECPEYMKCLYNSIETTHGTFVISHHGTSQEKHLYAVSMDFLARPTCTVLHHAVCRSLSISLLVRPSTSSLLAGANIYLQR